MNKDTEGIDLEQIEEVSKCLTNITNPAPKPALLITMYIIGFIFSSKVPAVIFEILLWPKLFFYDIIIGKNYFSQKI